MIKISIYKPFCWSKNKNLPRIIFLERYLNLRTLLLSYAPQNCTATLGFFFKMRISIFIDGNNFYFGLKRIYKDTKKMIDFSFEKFCNLLSDDREIIKIYYYNASLDRTKNTDKYKSQQRFFNKIKKVPKFNLILCRLIRRKIKGTEKYYYVLKEDDIHMAVDMVEGAFDDKFDIALLVSGDGDFVPAVKAVQRKGKQVENIYFNKTFSSNLKRHCNKSIKLAKDMLDRCFEDNKDNNK